MLRSSVESREVCVAERSLKAGENRPMNWGVPLRNDSGTGTIDSQMKQPMTLGKKLTACFAATSLVSAVLGISAWVYVTKLNNELEHMVHQTGRRTEIISGIKTSILTFRLAERGILLFSSIHNQEKVASNRSLFGKSMESVAAAFAELRPMLETEKGRQLTAAVETGVAEYARIQAGIPAMCAAGKVREATQFDADRLVPVGTVITKSTDEILALQRELNVKASERAGQVAVESRIAVGSLLALSLIFSALAAVVIRRNTRELQSVAAQLAEGADQISSAASQVASSSQSLAQGVLRAGRLARRDLVVRRGDQRR